VIETPWLQRVSAPRRAVYRALRAASFACRAGSRALDRLAAGALTAADLRAAQLDEWRSFNATADQTATGLMPWEERFYDTCLAPGDRILLIGCGAGRDLIALARRGICVDGVEPVPELAAAGRTHAAQHDVATTITTAAFGGDSTVSAYDAYVFSYFCYTYIRGAASRIDALRAIRRAAPNARVLVSAPARESARELGFRFVRLGNLLGAADWRAERGDVFGIDESLGCPRYYHAFTEPQLEEEMRAGGFRISRRIEDVELQLVEAVADV